MREYRFLLLDGDQRAVSAMPLVCLDDADALRLAGFVARRNAVEVWSGNRLVGSVPAQTPRHPAET